MLYKTKEDLVKELKELRKSIVSEKMKERLAPSDKTLRVKELIEEFKSLSFDLEKLQLERGTKK